MIVIAHRGASAYAPENTEAAFDLGLRLGSDALETDIRATRDGALVLLHDADVDRTTDGHGPVAGLDLAAVEHLDAGRSKAPEFAGQRVPTLDWFLDRYGTRCPLYLEIKAPGVEPASVEAVRRRGLLDEVVFTSFHLESLRIINDLARVRTCWLVPRWTAAEAEQVRATNLYEISVSAEVVTRELVDAIHARGLGCRAWRLNDDALMRRAVESGVDGATVNFPDRLLRLLGRPGPAI